MSQSFDENPFGGLETVRSRIGSSRNMKYPADFVLDFFFCIDHGLPKRNHRHHFWIGYVDHAQCSNDSRVVDTIDLPGIERNPIFRSECALEKRGGLCKAVGKSSPQGSYFIDSLNSIQLQPPSVYRRRSSSPLVGQLLLRSRILAVRQSIPSAVASQIRPCSLFPRT